MRTVQVCGISTLDIIHTVGVMPTKPEKYVSTDASMVVGGCAANAAIAIARLGGSPVLLSRLGDDQIGQLVKNQLQLEGVDCTRLTIAEGGRSSFSSILVDAKGERQIVNYRGQHLPEHGQKDEPEMTVHATLVDSRWHTAAIHALEQASNANIPGIVDAEPPINPELLGLSTHIAFSKQGLLQYTKQTTIEAGLRAAAKRHDTWICVTDGEHGCFVIESGNIIREPALNVPVVDTLGAGDVWHGAFALQLADGKTEMESVRFANTVSALKCMSQGGGNSAPTQSELKEFLSSDIFAQAAI